MYYQNHELFAQYDGASSLLNNPPPQMDHKLLPHHDGASLLHGQARLGASACPTV